MTRTHATMNPIIPDQENVDGARDVFGLVFTRSEDINELSTPLDELLDIAAVDHRGYVGMSTSYCCFSASSAVLQKTANSSATRGTRDDLRPLSSAEPSPERGRT